MTDEKKQDAYRMFKQIGYVTMIPMALAAGPLAGFFIGNFIDSKFKTAPWFLVIFVLLGFGASIKETIYLIERAKKESE